MSLTILIIGGLIFLVSTSENNTPEKSRRLRVDGYVLIATAISLKYFLGW